MASRLYRIAWLCVVASIVALFLGSSKQALELPQYSKHVPRSFKHGTNLSIDTQYSDLHYLSGRDAVYDKAVTDGANFRCNLKKRLTDNGVADAQSQWDDYEALFDMGWKSIIDPYGTVSSYPAIAELYTNKGFSSSKDVNTFNSLQHLNDYSIDGTNYVSGNF